MTDLPPDLISLPKAAERLGISEKTAQRLAAKGEFPGDAAIKVGRAWRVSSPRLERHLHGDAA